MHEAFMRRAIKIANNGLYSAHPNPRVGCVIVKNGAIIGEGWHVKTGQAHAEVNALNDCRESPQGASAYVTLEPCSHYGRTPPCAKALIDAGVKAVFIAAADPNKVVAGQGVKLLKDHGIEVSVGLLAADAEQINPGYLQRMRLQRPYIRVKSAMSLDGRTAMASGESQWVTGAMARQAVQRLRARSSAVVTGINTVLIDDARFTVRQDELGLPANTPYQQPFRIVLDSEGKLPESAAILAEPGKVHILVNRDDSKIANFKDNNKNITIKRLASQDNLSRIDLKAVVQYLYDLQCNEVLIEAGPTLSAAFLQAGLIDEWIVFMAPKLLGSNAKPLVELSHLNRMSQQVMLDIEEIHPIGKDWCIIAYPNELSVRSNVIESIIQPPSLVDD